MKLLLLACVIGFAAADFIQDAAPVVKKTVEAFLEGAHGAGSLAEKLGVDDEEIEQMADDLENELGQKIRDALNNLLEKIKDQVNNGKAVGLELLEKVKELRRKMKGLEGEDNEKLRETLKLVKEKVKEALRNILEKLGFGKRNLDDSMDQVARMKFREILERIKEKILSNETIQKLREYITNHSGKSELVEKLQEFVSTLRDGELKELIGHFLDLSPGRQAPALRGETLDKLKDWFKGLNIKLQDHSKKFGLWVKDMWGKGLDKLKDKYGTIKAIAMEFISNSKDMSAEMSREALEFFRPYKDDLGSLWNKLVDATKEAIGKF